MKQLLRLSLLLICWSYVSLASGQDDYFRYIDLIENHPDSIRPELIKGFTTSKKIRERADFSFLIGKSLEKVWELDLAILYFNQADSLYGLFHQIPEKRARNLQGLGGAYYKKGQLSVSFSLYSDALSLLKNSSDYQLKSEVLLDVGWLSREQGKHADALKFYFDAIELANKQQDEVLLARCYAVTAIVYHVKKEFSTALDYYKKALKLRKEQKNYSAVASIYNNLGLLQAYQKDYTKALYYYEKAYKLNDSLENKKGMAIQNENMGLVYFENLNNHKKAMAKYALSLSYWRESGDIFGQSQTLIYMVYVLDAEKKHRSSSDTAFLALRLAREAGAQDVELEALKYLSKSSEELNQAWAALTYYKQYISLRDSLEKINTDEKIDRIELEMEYAGKQLQDSLQLAVLYEKEQGKILLDVESGKFWNKLLIVGLLGLGIISILVFVVGYQRKRRVNLEKENNALLTQKNKEIIDSINYAKQIQSAILPHDDRFITAFKDSFILYKPKDIVAGDFYWIEETRVGNKEYLFFAVADCTGHGVPGAMVSVICSGALNKAVLELRIREPGQILNKVTGLVVDILSKGGRELKDGMDISLCCFEKETRTLTYAGANNALWLVSTRQEILDRAVLFSSDHNSSILHEIKATKQPVGRFAEMKDFETHTMKIREGDQVYLFTDGYPDQFGGKKNKKFKYKVLKNLILQNTALPLSEQKHVLSKTLSDWMGDFEQVDDICIMGVKF